jgi:5-methylcytosine-specific restriction endonuclease McrA
MPRSICQVCATPIPHGSRCLIHAKTRQSKGRGSTRKWRETRLRILRRDAYRCHYCGQAANTVDHVIPKAKGGTDDPSNLVAACARCNYSAQDWTPAA